MSEEFASQDLLFSHDFQRAILKILATNTVFAANYGTLISEEYFDTQGLKMICGLVKNYAFTYNKELDTTSLNVEVNNYCLQMGLSDEVAKNVTTEARLVMNFHVSSEQFYTDNFIKFARRQGLKNALFKSVELLEKDGEYEQVLKLVDSAVSIGSGTEAEITYHDLFTIPETYLKQYSADVLIPSGFPMWDRALEGGMAPGEVHVILAPPKAGKSTTMVNFGANNLRLGKAVFHVSLEISKEDAAMKYAMNLSGMSKEQITRSSIENYRFKMRKYDELKPNLFINFWPEQTINAMTVRSWISRVRARTGIKPDLIIIDYDDCLLPTTGKSKDDMYNDAGQVYSDLIGLANYFKCPVLTAAQPQREAWGETGHLITHDKMAHSARKAHRCWSVSSLNFEKDEPGGILYLDITRRGESKIKIPIQREYNRAWVREVGR